LHRGLIGRAEVDALFTAPAEVQALLDVEAALARAQAAVGLIPPAAIAPIAAAADAGLYDLVALAAGTADAGIPTVPLVKALTARVAAADPAAARWVHFGATTQDIVDTALVLRLRCLLDLLDADLAALAAACAALARRHAATPMAGRTWLQQALPITFGLKAAGWLDAVDRAQGRLHACRADVLVLQMGGAAGTLASLDGRGRAVAAALARDLGLGLPPIAWHAHRDRPAALACALGLLVGTLGKLARDVALMAQTETGSAAPGKGASSTMPHKRNPVGCAVILAAATRAPGLVATMLAAMPQEHERGLGGWHAEWDALPELATLTGGALRHAVTLIAGLEVDPGRMRATLEATGGQLMAESLMMALAPALGRLAAKDLVERACRRAAAERRALGEIAAREPAIAAALDPAALARALDPAQYLGEAEAIVADVLAAHERAREAPCPS
jgi:3-carboxy-cis,cis-muconate cycloisomerase